MRLTIVSLVVILLSGCVTAPLTPIKHDIPATVKTNLRADIELNSGVITGEGSTDLTYAGGNLFIPVQSGPIPSLFFNKQDQETFVKNLANELSRLGIAKTTYKTNDNHEVKIKIFFARTVHIPHHQQYILNVAMQITDGKEERVYRYDILSSDGDSWWEKINTNASEGKHKAAKKLMKVCMRDIEEYLSGKIH